MVDSIEAKWELTEKMCPMLQENPEFGEKFTALGVCRIRQPNFVINPLIKSVS
jgi:hypothetical protein